MQAANCPGKCNCREYQVACPRGLPSPEQIPENTKTLILGPSNLLIEDFINFITSLSLNQLQHLTLSSCTIRNFDNITFDQFTQLQTIDLSSNLISELSEETSFNQSVLKVFDISNNLIHTIHGSPFRTLCSLEVLNLSGNAISIIPENAFTGLSALISLDLSKNNITEIKDKTFESMNSLQQLNLSKNRIVTLSENCFSSLQKLQQLDISWNKLSYVSPTTLQALPSLSRLMIAGNLALGEGSKDSALLVGTGKRLQTLDASKTGLEHVPAALTHSVRTLRLAGNSIRYIECGDLDSYPLLQLLDLTSNLIEEIEEDSLGRLEMLVILYLTDNKLHGIPRSLPDGLKILHLEFNRIEQIVSGDLLGLPKLEVLLLNDNNIKVVQEGAFSQVTSLITLDLSRNPISILPAGTLSGPTSLQVLRLSSLSVDPPSEDGSFPIPSPEHLVRLDLSHSPGLARQLLTDKAVLSAFRELQELNLTNTNLVYLRSDLLHFMPQLRDLHITENRLNCSGLLWLTLWMRVQDQPEHRQVICFSPPELYGTPLIDLQDDNNVEITTTTRPPTTIKSTTTIRPLTTIKSTIRTTPTNESTIRTNGADWNNAKIESNGTVLDVLVEEKSSEKILKNETVRMSSGAEIAESVSAVTAAFQNRSDIPDVTTESQVHLYQGIESPILELDLETETTLSDGHIAKINLTGNRPTTEPSNYIETTTISETEVNKGQTTQGTSATTSEYKPTSSFSQKYVNEEDNLTANNPTSQAIITLPNDDIKLSENSNNATAQMSMYSSRRENYEPPNSDSPFVHPGMFVLLAAVLGTALVLSTLISHVRKKRKRLGDEISEYSRQQDIEVNSLPGFSELW